MKDTFLLIYQEFLSFSIVSIVFDIVGLHGFPVIDCNSVFRCTIVTIPKYYTAIIFICYILQS